MAEPKIYTELGTAATFHVAMAVILGLALNAARFMPLPLFLVTVVLMLLPAALVAALLAEAVRR